MKNKFYNLTLIRKYLNKMIEKSSIATMKE